MKSSLIPVVATILCGCVGHLHRDAATPDDYRYVPPNAAESPFDAPGSAAVELSPPIEVTRFHEVRNLSFPSSGYNGSADNTVRAIYYRSRSSGPKKLVIVLPIWGTSTYPPSRITKGYARRSGGDADVIWVLGESPLFPWAALSSTGSEQEFEQLAQQSAERYRTAVVDMRQLLDWAGARPEIDASRIALVGFSMSALVAATLMGNDPRVSVAVLMMGAANLADVFSSCENRAGEVREHVMTEYGWSLDRYHAFFEGLFGPADPVHYTGRYDPENILMIEAAFDDCMPRTSRDALWEATGRPERLTLLARHRSGFYALTPLGLNFVRRRIYAFLDDHL